MPRVIVLHVDWDKTTTDERWDNRYPQYNLRADQFKVAVDATERDIADFETVYMMTNNIDFSWTENFSEDDVTDINQRSTSMGDIVYIGGQGWRKCVTVGWTPIGDELRGALDGLFGM